MESASLHLYVVCSPGVEVAESKFRSASGNANFRAPVLTGGGVGIRPVADIGSDWLFLISPSREAFDRRTFVNAPRLANARSTDGIHLVARMVEMELT